MNEGGGNEMSLTFDCETCEADMMSAYSVLVDGLEGQSRVL